MLDTVQHLVFWFCILAGSGPEAKRRRNVKKKTGDRWTCLTIFTTLDFGIEIRRLKLTLSPFTIGSMIRKSLMLRLQY